MIIAGSQLNFFSQHSSSTQDFRMAAETAPLWQEAPASGSPKGMAGVTAAVQEDLAAIRGSVYQRGAAGGGAPAQSGPRQPSPFARAVRLALAGLAAENSARTGAAAAEPGRADDMKTTIIKRLLEFLTGKEIKMDSAQDILAAAQQQPAAVDGVAALDAAAARPGAVESRLYEYHAEEEQTTFTVDGTVRTQDGREIAIAVELNMRRSFARERRIDVRAAQAADPLVINFNGAAAELTQTKFAFDLDADGREDQISSLGADSGMLALDANGDGAVNDGRELFGAASGNGFADLAQYDGDGNLWIDGNDPIFGRLRVWQRDGEGNSSLVALGEKGIGAIFLGQQDSPFDIKDANNELQGRIRATGVFLHEDGAAGTLQQLDLVV